MKKMKKGLSFLTVCLLVMSMTAGVYQAAVYDPTGMYGEMFPDAEDPTAENLLFPGDSIVNTEVILDPAAGPQSNDMLDDGTPSWKNKSGTVYHMTVSSADVEIPVEPVQAVNPDTGEPMFNDDGSPVYETVEPVYETHTSCQLDTWGGTLEVINGTLEGDPNRGYFLTDDPVYTLDGENVPLGDIDAAAYPLGSSASLTAKQAEEGEVFQTWAVYTADGTNLNPVSGDQLGTLIPGLTAEALAQPSVTVPVSAFESRVVFKAVYAAEESAENETPDIDPTTGQPVGEDTNTNIDPTTGQPVGEDTNTNIDPTTGQPVNGAGTDGQQQENAQNTDPESQISILDNADDSKLEIKNNDEFYTDGEPQTAAHSLTLVDAASDQADPSAITEGTMVTVTASDRSAEGLAFTGWTAAGLSLDADQMALSTISFTMPASDVSLTAGYNQVIPDRTLTVTNADVADVEMTDNGDGSRSAVLKEGTAVQVTAADRSAEGLTFKSWTASGVTLGEDQVNQAQISVTVPASDVVLTAEYEEVIPDRTLTVTNADVADVEMTDNGDGSRSAVLKEGTAVQVTAADRDAEGLVFKGWTANGVTLGDDQVSQTQISVAIPASDVSLTAEYEEKKVTETITVTNGTIENVEASDNGDGTQSAAVEEGTTVQVTADAAPEGQEFEKWNVTSQEEVATSDITDPTLEVTVGAASVDVVPVYAAADVNVTVSVTQPAAGGTISPSETKTVPAGNPNLTYTLTPNTGYQIDSFTAKIGETAVEGLVLSEDKKTLTVPISSSITADTTINVSASLSLAPYTLTVNSGSGSGSFKMGDQVTIAANAAQPGYRFTKWTVSGGGTIASDTASQTTFTMDASDAVVTANYEQISYTLSVNSGSGSGTHYSGDQVVITANTPKSGYRFRNWTITSGSGTLASETSSQTTFTMTTSDAVLTANYELIPYTLTVKKGTGSGTFTKGTSTSITPNFPASGKEFDYWEKTSGKISIDNKNSYYATVTMKASDATVTAIYKDGPNPNNNTITGLENGAEYLKSTTLTFTAGGAGMDNQNPNPGDYRYRPSAYQIGSVGGSWTASPYTTSMAINAVGDYTLTVTYAKDVFDGSTWNADGTTVTKSVTFHVVNALSVQTGDSSPLIPLAIAGCVALVVIIALVVLLKKRRKKE